MIKVEIGKYIGSPTASLEKGVERVLKYGLIDFYLLSGTRGFAVIYECNNG